jgi:signal transduction histidine kinase
LLFKHQSTPKSNFVYKKAIDIYQYNSNQEGKIFTLINLADAYYQLKKYKKSKKYYTQALKLANDIKETQLKLKCYLGLFENAVQLKNKKETILFFKKYIANKDSIYEQNKIKDLIKYKTELKLEKTQHQLLLAKKDKKIKEQKLADNQTLLKQKDIIIVLTILFACILLISLILLVYFFRKQKYINKLLQQNEEELNSKNKIIDHYNKNLELLVKEKTQELINEIEQRKVIEQELVVAKELAEESDKLKSEFLSNISHEIRTPLNSIMGFSDIIVENNVDTEDIIPYATIIRKNGFLLLGIINDLIDIAKIEAEVLHVEKNTIKVEKLLTEIKTELKSKLKYLEKENKIEIRYNFPKNYQNDIILSDEGKLITIFNRLLNNAIQYTENGFIEIGYNKVGEQYNFYITDTGMGIPPERLHQIFKNFRKFRKNENFNYRGLGVGLFIAHKLLQMMDSQLEVKSVVNKGSTFYFSL